MVQLKTIEGKKPGLSINRVLLLLVLIVYIALLTIPRLLINYGMDADAVRGVKAAVHLWETGYYHPSRLPGNPLFEYILAGIAPWGGHIATNLLVLLGYITAVSAFALLTSKKENRFLLVTLFATTPILLLNAAATLDYLPGLALLLFSYVFITKKKYLLSAVFLALSASFRLTNLLFLFPLIFYMVQEKEGIARILRLSILSLALGLSLYIPIVVRTGLRPFLFPFQFGGFIAYLFRSGHNAIMLFGTIATLGIAVLIIVHLKKIVRVFKKSSTDSSFYPEIISIILFLLVFLLHPDEPAYLIPLIPFLYLSFSRWLSKKGLIFLLALVASFAFVNLDIKGGESGKRRLAVKLDWGIVVKDYCDRHELESLRQGIGQFHLSEKAVIITGMGPILTYQNSWVTLAGKEQISPGLEEIAIGEESEVYRISGQDVYLVYSMPLSAVKLLQSEGYDIYIFSMFAPSIAINKYGYDPQEVGISTLSIFNEKTFYE